mgnify:CR=1 FL=1
MVAAAPVPWRAAALPTLIEVAVPAAGYRERIALWEGSKGALLEQIMGERDAIADSDQGRSFRAFWDYLMSSQRQEELSDLLDRVLALPPVADLQPEARRQPHRRLHLARIRHVDAARRAHSTASAGYLADVDRSELPIRQSARVTGVRDIASTVVTMHEGLPITLRDVAEVALAGAGVERVVRGGRLGEAEVA